MELSTLPREKKHLFCHVFLERKYVVVDIAVYILDSSVKSQQAMPDHSAYCSCEWIIVYLGVALERMINCDNVASCTTIFTVM